MEDNNTRVTNFSLLTAKEHALQLWGLSSTNKPSVRGVGSQPGQFGLLIFKSPYCDLLSFDFFKKNNLVLFLQERSEFFCFVLLFGLGTF